MTATCPSVTGAQVLIAAAAFALYDEMANQLSYIENSMANLGAVS